jgi:quercetin dioxygenase-like cupin family protein
MSQSGARTINDLASLTYADRHDRARYAPVHRTDELQIGVYVLEPDGRIPAHRHSTSWDIALVLEGAIEVVVGEGAQARVAHCGVHAINLVPPGTLHAVRNAATDAPARFLLVQSPSRGFDFLRESGLLAT